MKKADGDVKYKDIMEFFKNLKFNNFSGHDDFMFTVVPEFAKLLGYDEDAISYKMNIGRKKPFLADAVIKRGAMEASDLVVETIFPGNQETNWNIHLLELSDNSGKDIVLISPLSITVFIEKEDHRYCLASIEMHDLKDIKTMLETRKGKALVKKHAVAS